MTSRRTIASVLLAAWLTCASAAGGAEQRPKPLFGSHVESRGPICFVAGTIESEIRLAHARRPKTQPYGGRLAETAASGGVTPSGSGLLITWSYVPDGTLLPPFDTGGNEPSTLFADLNVDFPGGFAQWHAVVASAFAQWEQATGNTYRYEPNDDGAAFGTPGGVGVRGDIRIGMRFIPESEVLAFNRLPSGGSDMVLSSRFTYGSTRLKYVVLHEHGHGLGLMHVCPGSGTKVMEPIENGLTTLSEDDILGGQILYGDPLSRNGQDNGAADIRTALPLGLGVHPGTTVDMIVVPGGGFVSVTVQPRAQTYLEGPQNSDGSCTAGMLFDLGARADLQLQARATDGVTVLAERNVHGMGASETIQYRVPSGQTHSYVRVGASGSGYQRYSIRGGNLTPVLRVLAPKPLDSFADVFADGFESELGKAADASATESRVSLQE